MVSHGIPDSQWIIRTGWRRIGFPCNVKSSKGCRVVRMHCKSCDGPRRLAKSQLDWLKIWLLFIVWSEFGLLYIVSTSQPVEHRISALSLLFFRSTFMDYNELHRRIIPRSPLSPGSLSATDGGTGGLCCDRWNWCLGTLCGTKTGGRRCQGAGCRWIHGVADGWIHGLVDPLRKKKLGLIHRRIHLGYLNPLKI